ncbi:gonadotropin-releasing hormone II receptor-like isoform X2 [Paramacrobiotus metropolitanus]|uniref:gonadotropin-releasing hormone II receptor-like isoform X2 n=1 Tax=Paramacrobiotus metropolitanus TaxID=2943436 RepID=UPI0024465381|nr:gonadotropin-releasing hormone II receptor-like isoform X2 [Paramacrobiotus metropolitanus]
MDHDGLINWPNYSLVINKTTSATAATVVAAANNNATAINFTLNDFKELTRSQPSSILTISVYSVLLFFGLIGNLVVFSTLLKSRYRKSSRVNKLILHLAIADLIVCCFTIPIEIGSRITVTWEAGDVGCRIFQFFRPFGLYLSSNTIICISLDRYFAIVQPLKLADARRRGRIMLAAAWIFAVICSAPQVIVFRGELVRLQDWPDIAFTDCLSTGIFEYEGYDLYSIFSVCVMYVLPLAVTVAAYTRILWEISITRRLKATSQTEGSGVGESSFLTQALQTPQQQPGMTCTADENSGLTSNCNGLNNAATPAARHVQLHTSVNRSASANVIRNYSQRLPGTGSTTTANAANRMADLSKIERARSRTLKLTILIVLCFVTFNTPYTVMFFWYQIDKASAELVAVIIQEILFLFAVSNSIINPYLYGIYSKSLRNEISNSLLCRAVRNCFMQKNDYGGSSSDMYRDVKEQPQPEPMYVPLVKSPVHNIHNMPYHPYQQQQHAFSNATTNQQHALPNGHKAHPLYCSIGQCTSNTSNSRADKSRAFACGYPGLSRSVDHIDAKQRKLSKRRNKSEKAHSHVQQYSFSANSTSSEKSLVSEKARSCHGVGRNTAYQRVTAAYKISLCPKSNSDLHSSSFD